MQFRLVHPKISIIYVIIIIVTALDGGAKTDGSTQS